MTPLVTASVDAVLTVLVPLLDEVPEADEVNTGWWYVLVVFGLFFVVYLLWLSMRKQLKKIRFDEDRTGGDAAARADDPSTAHGDDDPGPVR